MSLLCIHLYHHYTYPKITFYSWFLCKGIQHIFFLNLLQYISAPYSEHRFYAYSPNIMIALKISFNS